MTAMMKMVLCGLAILAPVTAAQAQSQAPQSKIIASKDITLRGKPTCEIEFVYAGYAPENLFWDEPCADVTMQLMTQADLEALGEWDDLDDFDRKFINAMPEGKVLYVAGSSSASIYPVGTTNLSYEIFLAD